MLRLAPAIRAREERARVRGTRLTVGDVLEYLATDASEQELLRDHLELTHDLVQLVR